MFKVLKKNESLLQLVDCKILMIVVVKINFYLPVKKKILITILIIMKWSNFINDNIIILIVYFYKI